MPPVLLCLCLIATFSPERPFWNSKTSDSLLAPYWASAPQHIIQAPRGPLPASAESSLLGLFPCILWCSRCPKRFAIFQMCHGFYVFMLLFTLPKKAFLAASPPWTPLPYGRLNTGQLLHSSQRPLNDSLFCAHGHLSTRFATTPIIPYCKPMLTYLSPIS